MSIKILHVFSGFGGGVGSLIGNLSRNRLPGFDFDLLAFSYKGGDAFVRDMESRGIGVFEMPRPRKDGYGAFKKYVLSVMKSGNYDAVHCHITGWRAKIFYDYAKRCGIKVFVTHAHSTTCDNRIDRLKIMRLIGARINYKCSDMYMTCSDLAASYMFGDKFLQKKELFLVPNGADISKFEIPLTDNERAEYSRELGIDDGDFVLLQVGRFTLAKNHPFILEIMKSLKDVGIKAKLIFAGDGELFDEVKASAYSMGLSDHIRFLGRRSDVAKLMQYADLMILPSFNEGLPTVIVECQAAGTPAFVSDTVTRQCDMQLGLVKFLPIQSTDLWVDSIKVAISAPSKKMSDNSPAMEKIEQNGFSARAAGEAYCHVISKLVEKKTN